MKLSSGLRFFYFPTWGQEESGISRDQIQSLFILAAPSLSLVVSDELILMPPIPFTFPVWPELSRSHRKLDSGTLLGRERIFKWSPVPQSTVLLWGLSLPFGYWCPFAWRSSSTDSESATSSPSREWFSLFIYSSEWFSLFIYSRIKMASVQTCLIFLSHCLTFEASMKQFKPHWGQGWK